MTRIATVAALTALTACSFQSPGDQYRNMLPDDRLRVEVPTELGTLRSATDEISESYMELKRASEDVNGGLADVIRGLREIISFDPTWSNEQEDTALWGPWDEGDHLVRLWVHHQANDAWQWALEIRPIHADDEAWVPVIAGDIEEGGTPDANAGHIAIDFSTITASGAGDGEVGFVFADYEVRPEGAKVQVSFEGFSEGGTERADALYSFEQIGLSGSLDLAYTNQAVQGGEPEIAIVRSRWDDTGAGRADVNLTAGDLGDLTYQASECWDADKMVVFYEDNANFDREGDEALCVFAEANFPE